MNRLDRSFCAASLLTDRRGLSTGLTDTETTELPWVWEAWKDRYHDPRHAGVDVHVLACPDQPDRDRLWLCRRVRHHRHRQHLGAPGKAGFVGFAPTRAAQRIPAESIAREVVPKGVAVAQQDRSAWSFNVELRPFREAR